MAEFRVTFTFEDVLGGQTTKTWSGTFADYTAANTAVGLLSTDLQALTDAGVIKYELAEVVPIATAANAGSNVFERISATVSKEDGAKHNMTFPSPVEAVFSGNALDVDHATWTAYLDNFTATSGWEISDGEHVDATAAQKGKRIYVRSGKSFT